ncbi:beta-1,6-N-acetylglucosaminyltransferase [Pedobacter sp.]|uniref:beta-1,6-N-acetylglucosaminyltransferase n=1 Tax=Pedobacter sp. TaxID=1411316 RepID=UPI003BACBBA0
MQIAHIIMAHKNPKQVAKLIKALEHQNFDYYIHVDKKTDIQEFIASLNDSKNLKFVKKRIRCNWGGYSFLKAINNSLAEVILSGKHYDFINLLSGQDYPLINSGRLYNFFENLIGKNFISYEENNNSSWWEQARLRYEKYHLTDFGIRGKYFFQELLNKFTPNRKFPLEVEFYGGPNSSWWTISAECALYVHETLKNNLKLNNFLKYSWGTDEFAIASLIMSSRFKDYTINNNFRYIDWSEGNAHPKILRIDDYEKIISSNMIFARKFDMEVDIEIINKIGNKNSADNN